LLARSPAQVSGFAVNHRFLAGGEEFSTDRASGAVASPCRAVFPSVINDLEVKVAPTCWCEKPFQIAFRLGHARPVTQSPPLCQSMDVRVDRERGKVKYLTHHHAGRFVAYAGERFEALKVAWDFSAEIADDHF